MKHICRILSTFLAVIILMTCAGFPALSEAVLTLPKALKIIDEEAFYGDQSIDKVVVPNGTTEIRARAFANSTLSEINLPDSLTFIDTSAFDGPNKVNVTANPGSYAFEWAIANKYISIPVVTTGNSSVAITAGNETLCKFVAPSAGNYIFMTTGSKDTMGVLYNASKNKLTEDDDSGDSNNFKIEYTLTSGQTVYIGVKYYSSSKSGTETLNISKSTPTVVVGNNSISVGAGEETVVKFTAPSAGTYVFTTTGSNDTIGTLYNSSMLEIDSDDDDGDGYNFTIEYEMTSGQTVYVGVKYYSSRKSGTETLNISKGSNIPVVNEGNNSVSIVAGQESLAMFTAPSTGTYVFMTTGLNDTKGVLYNTSMTELEDDDDSGSGNNFMIEYTLTNGQTVYIGVKYYSSSKSGTETLNISRSTPPTPTTITITFNANGGSSSTSSKSITSGSTIGTLPTATRSGYTFDGWFTSSSGGNKVTTSNTFTSNTTLYAHWTPNPTTITITFNANGGSSSTSSKSITSGSTIGTLPTATRSGYTFEGWYTSSSGGNKVTTSSTFSSNTTLYAHWTIGSETEVYGWFDDDSDYVTIGQKYYIQGTAGVNNGTLAKVTINVMYHEAEDYPYSEVTKTFSGVSRITLGTYSSAYVFDTSKAPFNTPGTYTINMHVKAADGTWDTVDSMQLTTENSQPTMVTITFNANGGSCSTPSKSITSGSAIGTLPTATRSGYTFEGWYTSSSGGNKVMTSSTFTSNTTLYAHWTPNPTAITITFNANGGSCSTSSKSITSGSTIGTLPTATRSGYTFEGWYTSSSGGSRITTSNTFTTNTTLYAHWEISIDFSVRHDSLSGDTLTMSPYASVGAYCTLKVESNVAWSATLSNSTYNFVKFVNADSSSANVSSNTRASGAANTTLDLRIQIVNILEDGNTSTAVLTFNVGGEEYVYKIKQTKPYEEPDPQISLIAQSETTISNTSDVYFWFDANLVDADTFTISLLNPSNVKTAFQTMYYYNNGISAATSIAFDSQTTSGLNVRFPKGCAAGTWTIQAVAKKGNTSSNVTSLKVTIRAATIVQVAESQIGKKATDFGFTGNWCAYFVTWCGMRSTDSNLFPSSATAKGNGKGIAVFMANGNKGTLYYFSSEVKKSLDNGNEGTPDYNTGNYVETSRSSFNPLPGDLILFDWNTSTFTWDHIAIVISSGSEVMYIGGNQGSASIVSRVSIDKSSSNIIGYIRPNYS